MTTSHAPGLKVTLQLQFDYDQPVEPQVAAAQQLVGGLIAEKAAVNVAIEDVTPPSSPSPKRRGRPPLSQAPPAETAAPLAASGNGADDLMLPAGASANPPVTEAEDAEDEDPFGLPPAGRTGKEALEQALGILRNVFNANHRKEVKAVQATMGVAQFTDIEAKDGHRLLQLAEQVAQKVGMRV